MIIVHKILLQKNQTLIKRNDNRIYTQILVNYLRKTITILKIGIGRFVLNHIIGDFYYLGKAF